MEEDITVSEGHTLPRTATCCHSCRGGRRDSGTLRNLNHRSQAVPPLLSVPGSLPADKVNKNRRSFLFCFFLKLYKVCQCPPPRSSLYAFLAAYNSPSCILKWPTKTKQNIWAEEVGFVCPTAANLGGSALQRKGDMFSKS